MEGEEYEVKLTFVTVELKFDISFIGKLQKVVG